MRLHRDDGPLRFLRHGSEIEANLAAVVSTDRSVVLSNGEASVATVEHLLAALTTAGFWSGVLIELDAGELPILDGSALPWQSEIEPLGAPPSAPQALQPSLPVSASCGAGQASITPGDPRLLVSVDYPHPAVGSQSWSGTRAEFTELLDARTFGFMNEFEALRASGLASGASLENAIVFNDRGPLRPLRHADEPVRHKALDLIGDLALLGRPLAATVRVDRGSHKLHVNLMRNLLSIDSPPKAAR